MMADWRLGRRLRSADRAAPGRSQASGILDNLVGRFAHMAVAAPAAGLRHDAPARRQDIGRHDVPRREIQRSWRHIVND